MQCSELRTTWWCWPSSSARHTELVSGPGLGWAHWDGCGVWAVLAGRERCFTLLSQPVTASNDFILTLCYQQQVANYFCDQWQWWMIIFRHRGRWALMDGAPPSHCPDWSRQHLMCGHGCVRINITDREEFWCGCTLCFLKGVDITHYTLCQKKRMTELSY